MTSATLPARGRVDVDILLILEVLVGAEVAIDRVDQEIWKYSYCIGRKILQ